MNRTIKVPGFTAEASLFTSTENYRSKARYTYHARNKMVVPQRRQTCFQMCKLAGNSDDMCHRYCDPYDPPVRSSRLFATRQAGGGGDGAIGEETGSSCPPCTCQDGCGYGPHGCYCEITS